MRIQAIIIALACIATCGGCSICPPGYLDDYATVGGKWQRSDPAFGRVGSILSDPGSVVGSSAAAGSSEVIHNGDYYDNDYYENDYLEATPYDEPSFTPAYPDDGRGQIFEDSYPNDGLQGEVIQGEIFEREALQAVPYSR